MPGKEPAVPERIMMALFTTSTEPVSRTRSSRSSRRDAMCHASQAPGSAPGSASAHLFGAPGSASELLPVDAASVAEGGSGLAPSSSSGRHHCGIWHINDHATKDTSTAQALYDAIPMIAPT